MSLKTVLFDMGNVLVFFSHDNMRQQIADACGVTTEDVMRDVFDSDFQCNFERGHMSEREFHQQLETRFERSIDFETLQRALADIFEPNLEMVSMIQSLKRQGLRIVLMSNTCVTHVDWIRQQFSVLNDFDDFTLSYEAGAIKPEHPIYESALTKIQCAPEECFYTDDIPEYVAKGREFGLQAEIFTGNANFVQHLADRGIHV